MSKAKERALETYPLMDAEHIYDEERVMEGRECFIEGYHQAEKDIKAELSKLFQEFSLDCIGDNKDIVILHFMDVFKNKLKEIGNMDNHK